MEIVTTRSSGEPLPERLQRVLEQLSGYDLSDVRVHADSPWPARLGARAFVLGSDIHLSSGAEDALEHEAWHVVQQKQGRVRATRTTGFDAHPFGALALNDEESLEREADTMGCVARKLVRRGERLSMRGTPRVAMTRWPVVQRQVTVSGIEIGKPARFEEEIKNRLFLVGSDVVDFTNIVTDMLNEHLVFNTWSDVKKEILVREVGYQAVNTMRELATVHADRFAKADKRYKKEIDKAKRDKSKKVDKAFSTELEERIYDEERLIRWGNASYLKYKARNRQLFQWLQGTRKEDPLVMNCWEAVIYALVKTELVHKSYITWCIRQDEASNADMVGLSNPNNLAASMLKNMDYFFWASDGSCGMARKDKRISPPVDEKSKIIRIAKDRVIPKGRILMFGVNEHVALSTGTLRNGRHGILELDGSTNTIQESTIEGLKGTYLTSMVVAPFPIAPAGSVRVVEEDVDKTQKRMDIKSQTLAEYQLKKDDVEALTQKKIAELQKYKEHPGNLQFEPEINELIEDQRKACRRECERLDSEATAKFERVFNEWLQERTPPNLDVITLQYQASDPYEGAVVLL
ncbi:DUF4157 domain-containing protein [Pyxidicoccus sp. MSG2]|uniref:eCIS core domain-containing protein n=1 Tax=Pyxidicoccus sp. MSG2 TaxID=2996790 RepID=UPI002270FC53|nr:DUF4157 domain-containing protein [Pyxidicoccus sp. MSG2]MCY1022994.1 DUF4157 domain-containing protein [Pyxidicoccus sp. MSG2]